MRAEFLRYLLAGLANTAVGYTAFLLALHLGGLDVFTSNLVSYAVGLCVAYVLNIVFVFKHKQRAKWAPLVFMVGFLLSYLANLGTLHLLVRFTPLPNELSQLVAMAVYTLSFYAVNKCLVFKD